MDHFPIRWLVLMAILISCQPASAQQDSAPSNIVSRLPGTCVTGAYYFLANTSGNNHAGSYVCNADGRTFMSITGSGAQGVASLVRKFFGVGTPGPVAGNLPGDVYFASNDAYFCAAPFSTAAPACTSVTSGGWTILNGGGGGGGGLSLVAASDHLAQTGTLEFDLYTSISGGDYLLLDSVSIQTSDFMSGQTISYMVTYGDGQSTQTTGGDISTDPPLVLSVGAASSGSLNTAKTNTYPTVIHMAPGATLHVAVTVSSGTVLYDLRMSLTNLR